MIDPVAFHVFGHPIRWYGVMVALGFLAAVGYWSRRARSEGKSADLGSEVALWTMVGGIVGARIAYVIANWKEYAAHPWAILHVYEGGLIFYGGFIGATLALWIFARVRKEPAWNFADFVIPAVPLGHALGRVGCFLNTCCWGSPCNLPWAATIGFDVDGDGRNDVVQRVHPVQLYEAAFNLALFALLAWVHRRRRRRQGDVVVLYLLLYPAGRFLFEFLRGDPRQAAASVTTAQWISLGLMALGALFWRLRRPAVPAAADA